MRKIDKKPKPKSITGSNLTLDDEHKYYSDRRRIDTNKRFNIWSKILDREMN